MKIRLKILVFLLAALSINCSKNNDTIPVPEVDISGDWILTAYRFEGSRRILNDVSVDVITFSATAWDIDVVASFSESPNDYSSFGIYNLDINIVDENGDEFYFPNTLEIDDVGTWSRNNSFLGITVEDELRQASISMLNDTTLKYVISSNTNETDENNQNVSVFRTDYFTYTRASD